MLQVLSMQSASSCNCDSPPDTDDVLAYSENWDRHIGGLLEQTGLFFRELASLRCFRQSVKLKCHADTTDMLKYLQESDFPVGSYGVWTQLVVMFNAAFFSEKIGGRTDK